MAEALAPRRAATRRRLGRDEETLRRVGDVRRAARRAGPRRCDQLDRAVGVGTGDLAARPLALRPAAARPTTRAPPGWTTGTTRCSPSPPPCSPPAASADLARRARHVRQGRGRAERGQRDPVAGHGLARRPRPRRADAVRRRRRGGRRASSQVHGGTVTEESWTDRDGLRRRRWRRGSPRCSAAGTAPVLATGRRARRRDPGRGGRARRRCCSSATRPGSRTRPPSTPSAADCLAGVEALADRRGRARGRGRR